MQINQNKITQYILKYPPNSWVSFIEIVENTGQSFLNVLEHLRTDSEGIYAVDLVQNRVKLIHLRPLVRRPSNLTSKTQLPMTKYTYSKKNPLFELSEVPDVKRVRASRIPRYF